LKEKKASELENYEKDYLSRLKGKKSTKSLERKKPAAKKTKKKVTKIKIAKHQSFFLSNMKLAHCFVLLTSFISAR